MSEILDFYRQQALKRVSSISWLAEIQTRAIQFFSQKGLPTRREEEWKYTSLEAVWKQPYSCPVQDIDFPALDHFDMPVPRKVIIQNELVYGLTELKSHLPQGVIIAPLSVAMTQHEALIKPHLDQILRHEHGLHALNSAMIQNGVFIYVPEGVHLKEPIALIHRQNQEGAAFYFRHVMVAKPNSEFTVIEDYQGLPHSRYLTNTMTELQMESGAKVTHYKMQREGGEACHLGHLFVRQLADSQFASHSVSLGGKLMRSDVSIDLQEEQAQCLMNGIYVPREGQHMDHHTVVRHLVPDCRSEQDYKGILQGKSRAVFNGKVVVAAKAQHSEARQHNKNLLLSPWAEMNTKPQLEIFADDVICTHGATVGQLDEESLFYLATRGIDRQEASQYLIQAFANENLSGIPHHKIARWVSELIRDQVGADHEG